jgi:hypothetical protein
MKMTRSFVMVMAALFIGTLQTSAQELNSNPGNSFKDNWDIQLQPGFSQFYGDASNHNYFQKFKGEISLYGDLSVRKMIIPAVGVGLNFAYAGLKSYKDQKTDGTKVDFHLSGNYFDANLFVYVNFNHLFAGYKPGRHFTAYGTMGVGWGFWNSALTDGITGLIIKSGSRNGTYTYKTNAFVVPVSLGMNWRISERWGVNLGGTLRTVFNDDVDVWHDGFKYDQIFSTNVGVTYHIRSGWGRGKKQKQPKQSPCCNEKEEKSKPVIPIYDFDEINVVPAPVKSPKQPQAIELMTIRNKSVKPAVRGFEFRVQIMAMVKPLKNASALQTRYHLPYPVVETHQSGLYRYSVGSFSSYSKAVAASREIKSHGIFDAFVVAYRNGYRIPITSEMKKKHSSSSAIY